MGVEGTVSDYTERVKDMIRGLGAALVGVADVEPLKALEVEPPDLLDPFSRAIAIAIPVPRGVFEKISDRPTRIYRAVYETVNRLLDDVAVKTAIRLEQDGYGSMPIPASQILDREELTAAVSHKAVARMAGLGWQGKNLLLITPEYGSRVRLATILTEAPLEADAVLKNRCGTCTLCQEACPAGAVKGVSTEDHYRDRDEALHFSRCVDQTMNHFAKLPGIGRPICGVCIKVCPHS